MLNQQKRNSEKMERTVVLQIVTHVKAEKKVRRNGLGNVTNMCPDDEFGSTADPSQVYFIKPHFQQNHFAPTSLLEIMMINYYNSN